MNSNYSILYMFLTTIVLFLFLTGCSEDIGYDIVDSPEDALLMRYNSGAEIDYLGAGLWGIPIPYDFDNDGRKDILVSCPGTPYRGLYFFRNIGASSDPFFDKALRISSIGEKNLKLSEIGDSTYVLSPGFEYCNFFKNPYKFKKEILYSGESIGSAYEKTRSNTWIYVDWDGDSDKDIIVGIDTWDDYGWDSAYDNDGNWTNGPLHGYLYLIENDGGEYINRGEISAGGTIIDVYGSPNPCIADFDGDGDLDIICGEFLDGLTWFENIGTRTSPEFAKGVKLVNGDGEIRFHVEMIVPVVTDFDEDGWPDLIVGDEDGRIAFVRNAGKIFRNGIPLFDSPEYFMQKADAVKFGALSTPFAVDWDNDGLVDLISGNSAGEIAFIRNVRQNGDLKWNTPELFKVNGENFRIMAGDNGSVQGPAESKWGYTVPTVADWDGDGFNDIIINNIWGKILWLRNRGLDDYLEMEPPRPIKVAWDSFENKPLWNWWAPELGTLVTQWRTTPYVIDWNKDGLNDIITLDSEGYLVYYERFISSNGEKLLKRGNRIFKCENCSVYDGKKGVINAEPGLLRLNSGVGGKSGRRKFCFMDVDNDGYMDLVVDSNNAAWFKNKGFDGDYVIFEYKGDIIELKLAGHTTSPTCGDIDGDGVDELILGAEDGHFYHIEIK